MSLSLSHCLPSDAPSLALTHYKIFSRAPLYRTMYRSAAPADVLAKYEKAFAAGIYEQDHPSPSSGREVHYLKITDDAIANEIVAYVVWIHLPGGYDVTMDPQARVGEMPAGTNEGLAREFKRGIGLVRGEDEGRKGPHLCRCLDLIFVAVHADFFAFFFRKFCSKNLL